MRVLFVAPPAKVHAFVQVPLAWALRAAGHEVCLASTPDIVEDVARTGLTAVPIGPALRPDEDIRRSVEAGDQQAVVVPGDPVAADAPPSEAEVQRLLAVMAEVGATPAAHDELYGVLSVWTEFFRGVSPPATVAALADFARFWQPDLIIWDNLCYGAPIAARACGAAHARLLFGLDLVGRFRQRYASALADVPPMLREDPLAEWLSWAGEPYQVGFSEDLVLGQWTIDPLPASMRLPVAHHYLRVRHVPYNGPSSVPDWLLEPPERPRVCLTLGLSHREVLGGDRASVAALLEAVADLDVEVVATLNAEQAGIGRHLPDNVRTSGFVPLNELLPHCAAVVHQGGFGTLQTALAHGVPQVLLPNLTKDWDSVPLAARVVSAGAGLSTPADSATAGEVRGMLRLVLTEPGFAAGAARVRTELLGTPAPADLVAPLHRLAARHRTAGAR